MRIHNVATINLSNGQNITVEQAELGLNDSADNLILNTKITEELSETDKNPIGRVAYSTLNLTIQSADKSLMPENVSSPYYGYMNGTAIISIVTSDSDGSVNMGTFYVEKWYSNLSSDEKKTITIMGNGYMKTISKMLMPAMGIKKNQHVDDYIREVIGKLNNDLELRYRIQVANNLTFGSFNLMQYNNLEGQTVGEVFDEISQSTLTNIYIDRNNELQTDDNFDDTIPADPYTIGDCENAKTIKVCQGSLSSYTGIELNHESYLVSGIQSLAQIHQTITSGTKLIDNIKVDKKIFKVMYANIKTESTSLIEVVSISYDKDTIDIEINNHGSDAEADIEIFGQVLNTTKTKKTYYIDNNNKSSVLQITNNITPFLLLGNFALKILRIVLLKSSIIEATGWFDIRLKLGDIVYLDADATVGITGNYKVIGLEWNLSSEAMCKAKLIKMISNN